jgi:AraC-like DNA-binding protein
MRLRPDAADWLGAVVNLLSHEAGQLQPGSEIVISRLTDLLFIQVLRAWMREHAPRQGWLAALSHPQIGPVLAAVHEQPERAWTVEALAALAHLSRSAFSARFAKVVGEPAQTYLMRLRMQAAARLISERRASLAEIAAATGYESEAAFNKAFKRWHGLAPGQFRELQAEAV